MEWIAIRSVRGKWHRIISCCWVTSVVSNSVQPHRRQPTRLPCPWDSPGKNTGVGCHFLLQCMKEKVKSLSRVWPSATPRTAAYQAPPSMGFSRQEYWSGVPLPSPESSAESRKRWPSGKKQRKMPSKSDDTARQQRPMRQRLTKDYLGPGETRKPS